jgi:tRNA(fMet)-specific endonuclease VapC
MYLLDTNICIRFLNGTDHGVKEKLLAMSPADVCLCSVVKAELYYGARNSQKVSENLRKLEGLFQYFESFSFNDDAAIEYGKLRKQLKDTGKPIGANDMTIAAIVLANDHILVTKNTSEFEQVPELKVESW